MFNLSRFLSRAAAPRLSEHLNLLLGGGSAGNALTLYPDTSDAFEAMWSAVSAAQHSIVWHTYILHDDTIGRRTLSLLKEAQSRGVKVTLLYDCAGNITGRRRLVAPLKTAGASIIHYRPFGSTLWDYVRASLRWRASPCIRNHRKILVVDDQVGFLGGLNIGNDYAGVRVGGNGRFRDTHCRLKGPAVQDLQRVMDDTIDSTRESWREYCVKRGVSIGELWRRKVSQWLLLARSSRTRKTRKIRLALRNPILRHLAIAFECKPTELLQHGVRSTTTRLGALNKPSRLVRRMRDIAARRYQKLSRRLQTPTARSHTSLTKLRKRLSRSLSAKAVLTQPALVVNVTHRNLPRFPDTSPDRGEMARKLGYIQILMSNPPATNFGIQLALLLQVRRAQHRVWVTTPYILPHRALLESLCAAAGRSVDVRVITGARSTTDPPLMWYASQTVARKLASKGVRLVEYHDRILHAKTVVVDDSWGCVGSYNWDLVSNKLLEVCAATTDHDRIVELIKQFQVDSARGRDVTLDEIVARPLWIRVACAFAAMGLRWIDMMVFSTYRSRDLSSGLDV